MTAPTPQVGEPLAVDLVNTRTAAGDLLATPADLAVWLALEAERHPDLAGLTAAPRLLDAALAVRGHTAAVLDALLDGRRPPEPALRALAAAVDAAPGRTLLTWDGDAVTAAVAPEGPAPDRLAAALARSAVAVLTDPSIGRLRQCAAEDCTLVFVPQHPRRQWCSPERCGNRVRVARHYERRRAGRG